MYVTVMVRNVMSPAAVESETSLRNMSVIKV
jgi:hypothetical protein